MASPPASARRKPGKLAPRSIFKPKGSLKVNKYLLSYVGHTNFDGRANKYVLPWIVTEIKRRPNIQKATWLVISEGFVKGISEHDSSDVLFQHKIGEISNFTNYLKDRRMFFYFHRTSVKHPFVLHLFAMESDDLVRDVYKDLQQSAKQDLYHRSMSLSPGLVSTHSLFSFEMRYQGRAIVGDRKGSAQFVDEWITSERERSAGRRFGVSTRGLPPGADKENRRRKSVDGNLVTRRLEDRMRHDSGTSECSSLPESWSDRITEEGEEMEENRGNSPSGGSSEASSSASDLSGLPSSIGTGSEASMGASFPPPVCSGSAMSGVVLRALSLPSTSGASDGGGPVSLQGAGFNPMDGTAMRSLRRRSTLIDDSDRSHAVLLQIDSEKLSVISLDKKDVILEKSFSQIAYCTPGLKAADHFGFICKDTQASSQYVMYIFQCASEQVVSEIMDTLKRAFATIHQKNQESAAMCEVCPMKQLSQLCEVLSEAKDTQSVHTIIQSKIVNLPSSDYTDLLAKVKTEECQSLEEANEVLMTKLRIICEIRQLEHAHTLDDNNRLVPAPPQPQLSRDGLTGSQGEFHLMSASKQSKLDAIRNRAKKAFSFDVFKKKDHRKASRSSSTESAPDPSIHDISLPSSLSTPFPSNGKGHNGNNNIYDSSGSIQNGNASTVQYRLNVTDGTDPSDTVERRPRAATIAGDQERNPSFLQRLGQSIEALHNNGSSTGVSAEDKEKEGKKSASSLLSASSATSEISRKVSAPVASSPMLLSPRGATSPRQTMMRRSSGWRREIFDKVVTPRGRIDEESSPTNNERSKHLSGRLKRHLGGDELRALWRSAIEQTILLNRMERENQNLRACQEESEMRRVQLDYEEVTPCLRSVGQQWTTLLSSSEKNEVIEKEVLMKTAKDGIPRVRRGEIWKLMAEQQALRKQQEAGGSTRGGPLCSVKGEEEDDDRSSAYHDLLEELTSHQHAILIDLGRTFPSHPYFKAQLGAGQLSLFNILKAYSLLDREVGYCQGLSFVAGILLMHTNEEMAFDMLRHLMFTVGLREQYKPDMKALQVRMYQLSRLLHDREKAIYDHFEQHEITPTFYAAPWIITLFASQFPIGFVARVFDLLFLEGISVLFKVSLALISCHKEAILRCDTFESISDCLKTALPTMNVVQMERVFSQVFSLDVSSHLHTYEAEYQVFRDDDEEERVTEEDRITVAEQTNAKLRAHNTTLQDTVHSQAAKIKAQETTVEALQQSYAKLKNHVNTLELEKAALNNTIGKLKELVPGGRKASKPTKRASVVPIVKISSPGSTEDISSSLTRTSSVGVSSTGTGVTGETMGRGRAASAIGSAGYTDGEYF